MDEKETLIRVEQQLQDSIKNQSMILSDLNDIFNKIDDEAKSNASVQAELTTHIETDIVRKEDSERRLSNIEEKLKDFTRLLSKSEEEFFSEFSSIKEEITEKLKQEIENLKLQIETDKKDITELKLYTKGLNTTLSFLKWASGFIALIITAIWPIIVFWITRKGP